jgi:hypothetical protein
MALTGDACGRISILMTGAAADESGIGALALPASIGGNWRSARGSPSLTGGK